MVKSNSCFKIMTCASDSADNDDLDAPQNKSSSDKRGWSFGKRSARHRVLENSVNSETPTSGNVKAAESAPLAFESPASTSVPENLSDIQCTDELPRLLALETPEVSATENTYEDQSKVDDKLDDQTKEVDVKMEDQNKDDDDKPEHESTEVDAKRDESAVVDVQTAVGGSLAETSPEELKNVIKLQAAVRGHLVRRQAVGTLRCVQAIVKMQALVRSRQSSQKDNHNSKALENANYISIEKLLSNSFARQLLESTPKNQPIHVKCDPSKPDSAWKWLETWMAASTKDTSPHIDEAVRVVEQESVACLKMPTAISESEESLITNDAENLNFQASHSVSNIVSDNNEQLQLDNTDTSAMKETAVEINLADADSNMEFIALSLKPVAETEQSKCLMKGSATELLETDERKSFDSSLLDASAVETQRDTFSSEVDSEVRAEEAKLVENPIIPQRSQLQMGSSECGTEISISSTLDSPDMSDAGALEHERDHDIKVSEETICSPNNTTNNDFESNFVAEQEKIDGVNGETIYSDVVLVSPQTETKPEINIADVQREYDDTAASMQAYGSEASPRSYLTVPESQQGTPSSLVSMKAKRSKADKSGSDKKRMSLSAGKKSPSNPNVNSASSKDHKNGKRRHSLGSPKPDQADQEPRDSSSSNSPYIPRFMQVTESARGKLQSNTSPRSSPYLQDREILIKKRHSLPGVNGKQGSPRIPAKATAERKWQR